MFGLSSIKWIAIGLAVLAVVAYVGFLRLEVTHYRTDRDKIQAEYNVYKDEVVATHAALQTAFDALTLKYKETLVASNRAESDKLVAITQRIRSDKELASIKLSANAIRLFNDGKAASNTGSKGTAAPKPGDASAGDKTLADLMVVVKINEKNQNTCVDALTAWQSWWGDFSLAVQKVGG